MRLSGAFLLNCELFALTLLFALPLGLVVSFGSMSRCKPLAGLVKTFVWIIRGTPLMLQIIVIYLGPGLLGMNNPWPSGSGGRMVAAVVAFAINYACYFSEIYRGGIRWIEPYQLQCRRLRGKPGYYLTGEKAAVKPESDAVLYRIFQIFFRYPADNGKSAGRQAEAAP